MNGNMGDTSYHAEMCWIREWQDGGLFKVQTAMGSRRWETIMGTSGCPWGQPACIRVNIEGAHTPGNGTQKVRPPGADMGLTFNSSVRVK